MERRLLFLLTLTVLYIFGCSREKSPPPATMAAAPVKANLQSPSVSSSDENADRASVGIAGLGFSGSGLGGEGSSASRVSSGSDTSDFFAPRSPRAESSPAAVAPSAPVITDLTAEALDQEQRELAKRARAEEVRRRVLEELQSSTILGAFGSAANKSGELRDALVPTETHEHNPLRADAPPRLASEPTTPNPLRQAGEPRIPATPPPPSALPSLPLHDAAATDSNLQLVDNSPSGGSAPPGSTPLGGGTPLAPQSSTSDLADRALIGGGAPSPSAPAGPAAAPRAEPPITAEEDESQFDVVEVLYGTDRLAGEQKASDLWHLLLQCLPTLVVAALAICLVVVGVKHRNWLLGAVAVTGLGVCLLLGYDAVDEIVSRIRGAKREGPRYTTDRSPAGRIEVGRCEVTIPKVHTLGEVESPSILRLEINENISRHLILQKTERLANSKFYDLLRRRVQQSAHRELFVFVHGFNVSFDDAARRTAQIHYDLKFEGAPIFFSWPANDKFIFTYPADETNVAWSVPHLKHFLLEIVKESHAQSINLIAHSMGNRALAAALREIELEMHDQARLFNQVILAAPDIDADDFRNNIAPAMQRTARGLTLYASSHDEALLASQFIHRRPRAGDAGDGLTVITGIDTIDVTAIDQSFWGHSYYGSNHPVLNDLKALLIGATPPRDRTWLSPAERDGLTYWIFQPALRTASAAEAAQAR